MTVGIQWLDAFESERERAARRRKKRANLHARVIPASCAPRLVRSLSFLRVHEPELIARWHVR